MFILSAGKGGGVLFTDGPPWGLAVDTRVKVTSFLNQMDFFNVEHKFSGRGGEEVD